MDLNLVNFHIWKLDSHCPSLSINLTNPRMLAHKSSQGYKDVLTTRKHRQSEKTKPSQLSGIMLRNNAPDYPTFCQNTLAASAQVAERIALGAPGQ